MTTQLNDLVAVDPVLAERKIRVHAVRLLHNGMDSDGDYRYKLTVALEREGKRWPKGSYHVRGYDSDGLMIANTYASENKSLDADRRHLEASFYAKELHQVEVILEGEDDASQDDGWVNVDVARDQRTEESLSLEVRGLRARAHPDFDYGNLTVIEVSGDITATYGLPFPDRLAVQLAVVDEEGHILTSGQYDLSHGPSSARPMNNYLKIYRHEDPALVRVQFFTR